MEESPDEKTRNGDFWRQTALIHLDNKELFPFPSLSSLKNQSGCN